MAQAGHAQLGSMATLNRVLMLIVMCVPLFDLGSKWTWHVKMDLDVLVKEYPKHYLVL